MTPHTYITKETAELLCKAGYSLSESEPLTSITHAQAMKWLRDNCRIYVSIRCRIWDGRWDCMLHHLDGKIVIPQPMLCKILKDRRGYSQVAFPDYETTAEAGIREACKFIIKKQGE